MGNCLVTKLKGTVENDDLSYLGYVKVKVLEDGQVYDSGTIKALLGTFDIANGESNKTEAVGVTILAKEGTELLIDKYSKVFTARKTIGSGVYEYSLLDLDLSELCYKNGIVCKVKDAIGITHEDFKNATEYIEIQVANNASIRLDGPVNSKTLNIVTLDNEGLATYTPNAITGNIENIVSSQITSINLINDIKGDLKVWIDKCIAAGHQDGSIHIVNATTTFINRNLTWDGKPIRDVLSRDFNFYIKISNGVASLSETKD